MTYSTARSSAVLAVCLCGAAPLNAQAPAAFERSWRAFAERFHQQMEVQGVVGGSIWFVRDGAVIGKEVHGLADRDTKRPVDDNTIYDWASNTKTLTGIAIMQLRDRGRLQLDDPVVRYLPELSAVHNPHGSMEAITIRHLMSHSAGFRSPTWPWGGDKPWHPHEPTEWSQLVAMLPYTEIEFAPGSRYSYSNPGIVFLGRIIELLSGDDYEVYIDKNILKPLGMHRSYFDITPYHLLRDRSNNYSVKDGQTTANGLDFDTGITTSNGGLNAPLPDMVRYVTFLMGAGDRATNEQVLERSSLEEMWRGLIPVSASGTSGTAANARSVSMGLTFFIYERGPEKIVGHTGGQKSFSTYMYIDPARRVASLAAFNTLGDPRPRISAILTFAMVFDELFSLFPPAVR